MDAIEKRARELLAAEYEREPLRNSDLAKQIRQGVTHNATWHALAALRKALAPPEGYMLVPVELPDMGEAPRFVQGYYNRRNWQAAIDDLRWLAARPEVP
ncbi:hypothetical protein JAK24_06055 [Stenotrophomonas maltophilia]|nr:hypothetical protein [Stenotrophomonas maltophilia]